MQGRPPETEAPETEAARRWRRRRGLALLLLCVGLPLYIVAAVSLAGWFDARFGRLPIWGECLVYIGLGIAWALPFRRLFRGIGQPPG